MRIHTIYQVVAVTHQVVVCKLPNTFQRRRSACYTTTSEEEMEILIFLILTATHR